MITQVTYARVFNLGNYESLRLEAVALVQDGAAGAAWEEARAAVEAEYAFSQQGNPSVGGASYNGPPATENQRNFIAKLQGDMGWTGYELTEHFDGVDFAALTKEQASKIIGEMKTLVAALKNQDLL